MDEKNWLHDLQDKNQLQSIISLNRYTEQFGVSLTEEDTRLLLKERKESLQEQERIEFRGGILGKLIFTFCDSPHIYKDNYVETLGRLQGIFYLYKNECLDEITDDELLDYMKHEFEGVCQGSLDYLEETCLDRFARNVRADSNHFLGSEDEDEESL